MKQLPKISETAKMYMVRNHIVTSGSKIQANEIRFHGNINTKSSLSIYRLEK